MSLQSLLVLGRIDHFAGKGMEILFFNIYEIWHIFFHSFCHIATTGDIYYKIQIQTDKPGSYSSQQKLLIKQKPSH